MQLLNVNKKIVESFIINFKNGPSSSVYKFSFGPLRDGGKGGEKSGNAKTRAPYWKEPDVATQGLPQ